MQLNRYVGKQGAGKQVHNVTIVEIVKPSKYRRGQTCSPADMWASRYAGMQIKKKKKKAKRRVLYASRDTIHLIVWTSWFVSKQFCRPTDG